LRLSLPPSIRTELLWNVIAPRVEAKQLDSVEPSVTCRWRKLYAAPRAKKEALPSLSGRYPILVEARVVMD